MNEATAAWMNTCSRSPRRIATMPASPPRKMYVVISSDEPLTAPPMTATNAMRTVAIDASRRTATSIAIAAVGRKKGRVGRPAVILSAIVAPRRRRPTRISTLLRCHSPGRKRQIQPSSMPTTRTASRSQPAKLVTSGAAWSRPSFSISSNWIALICSPLRTSTWVGRIVTRTGVTASAARSRAWAVSSALNDELGTTSGLISSAASIRSASSRPPAIRPDNRLRLSATSVSRSSVRSVASRTRAASVRTTAHREASSPTKVFRDPLDRSGIAAFSRVIWLASVNFAEKVVSICRTRRSKASCCSAAIVIAFSVV